MMKTLRPLQNPVLLKHVKPHHAPKMNALCKIVMEPAVTLAQRVMAPHRPEMPGFQVSPQFGYITWDTDKHVCPNPRESYLHTVSDDPRSIPMTAGKGNRKHTYKMSHIRQGALSLAKALVPGTCANLSSIVDPKIPAKQTWMVERPEQLEYSKPQRP